MGSKDNSGKRNIKITLSIEMSFRNFFTEEVILPFSDKLLGSEIAKHLDFLMISQKWSREELDNYQNERLRSLTMHAYLHVPYYNELFKSLKLTPDDIKSKDDLFKLPILTKKVVKENITNGRLIATNVPKKSRILSSSSGSTGEPLQFYTTKHSESFHKATAIRAWNWMGYRLGDKYVKISMNPRSSTLKNIQDYFNNCRYLSSNQLSSEEFITIGEEIRSFEPKYIRCSPVPLLFLSSFIKNYDGGIGDSLLAINTTGSTLLNESRMKIENVFKTKIYDSYSCEGGAICAECKTSENYHFAEEYAISELIEDKYTLADSEHPLRHITTDLHNYVTPFIRYDSQDYVIPGDYKQCSCGSNFRNIKKIKGRDSDILITPGGKYLIVENFVAYFKWVESVDQIQVVQKSLDEIVINLVVNNKYSKKVYQELLSYWKNYIGKEVNLSIEVVDEIKLTPSGKRRTLIRNPEISINI